MRILTYSIFFLSLSLLACNGQGPRGYDRQETTTAGDLQEDLIEANRGAVKTEEEQIGDLLRRYRWDMQQTSTGLRYLIDNPGDGPLIDQGDMVKLDYEIRLITGDVAYSSENDGHKIFTVGKDDVIAGLYEGIQLLRNGAEARFVIPSHLGYGLLGDQDRIKQKATLIYTVSVIDVKIK